MIVTMKTTIGFVLPDEYKQMMEFAEKNTDWVMHESTVMISFSKENIYSTNITKMEGGDSE